MHATTFAALGEPSRLQIVGLLGNGPLSVGEIADAAAIRQPQVSKHLRVLAESGIVTAEPLARQRIYHLQPEPFEQIGRWVDSFERMWELRLNSLDAYLGSIATKGTADGSEEG
jgi:DNA-binding transcriptional ArsR family regulator